MAKRRKRKVTARRRSYRKAPVRRRKKKAFGGEVGVLVSAGLYGALRGRAQQLAAPIANALPFGGAVADEVAMLALMFGAKKLVGNKVPMMNDIIKAGKVIEYARIGEAVAGGALGGFGLNNNGSSNTVTIIG